MSWTDSPALGFLKAFDHINLFELLEPDENHGGSGAERMYSYLVEGRISDAHFDRGRKYERRQDQGQAWWLHEAHCPLSQSPEVASGWSGPHLVIWEKEAWLEQGCAGLGSQAVGGSHGVSGATGRMSSSSAFPKC